jgi:hypothetical protein
MPRETHVIASGPDGRAFERFPQYNWVRADDPRPLQVAAPQRAQFGSHACDVMAPMSAPEYLRRNLPKFRPNAQLVGFEPAPKLMQDIQQQAQADGRSRAPLQPETASEVLRHLGARKVQRRRQADGEWILAATTTTETLGPLQRGVTTVSPIRERSARRRANWKRL